jgi:hypothetical protein
MLRVNKRPQEFARTVGLEDSAHPTTTPPKAMVSVCF